MKFYSAVYRPVGAKYIHRIIHCDTVNKVKFSSRHFGVLDTKIRMGESNIFASISSSGTY